MSNILKTCMGKRLQCHMSQDTSSRILSIYHDDDRAQEETHQGKIAAVLEFTFEIGEFGHEYQGIEQVVVQG